MENVEDGALRGLVVRLHLIAVGGGDDGGGEWRR